MVFLLISVTLLHLVILTMLFIATMEKSWWMWDDVHNSDLWYNCMFDNSTEAWLCASAKDNEWLVPMQALMVLAVLFSCLSFMAFLVQLFVLSEGRLFYLTGLCQFCAALTDFAACLIYTLRHRNILQDSGEEPAGHYGYCFILAWVCVPLLLASGVMYVHLRKKE
ncbi:hypothetical protein COCON_G00181090 [Conger conger]|uniref:Epithelial membrane protein 3 n=1 Tax=Conger conger TaxID=82655 RepID=A0A9Q1D6B3_CONCO|nr:epithelial membrane protein 3 [Conger conger]XP_061076592.1 epithelial membrane protein 3 [Conger conger]KAJ8259097.1 hypothetical protein COCON_G00181090 [Conger conger]